MSGLGIRAEGKGWTNGTGGGGGDDANSSTSDDKEPSLADKSLIQKVLRKGLNVTSKAEIEILRKDPSSTLYSTKSFEDMNL